ncbi:MAG: methyltransferase domain-containing protein [Spirochaetales bacterium]
MKLKSGSCTLTFDLLDQQIDFEGTFRPESAADAKDVFEYLTKKHGQVRGVFRLNFRRLRYINAEGVYALARFIRHAKEATEAQRRSGSIQLIASAVLAWTEHVLPNLTRLWDKVEFQVHDRNFYGSQGLIEDLEFIPLLRNQTRILWPLEKEVLRRHGLERGMRVADVCCGCGDVPLLVAREFHPSFITGIDHSEAAMVYARQLQDDFGVSNAEFQRGDATALMLADDSFDFVTCRLSLQIFSKPEQILSELIRITKPGGRIYTLCEDYDLIVGYPERNSIRHTYEKATEYGEALGMDLISGKKLYGMLTRARLEDVRAEHIMVDTANTSRPDFAKVIESWRQFSAFSIGDQLKLGDEDRARLLEGYDAQLRTIADPEGYTTWNMVACSGRKPL